MKKLLFPLVLGALVQLVYSHGDTTIILQNGVNGYNGCEDSYLSEKLATTSGEQPLLKIKAS